MHQIQVSAPEGKGEEVAKLALKVGIQEASVSQVFVHGPDKKKDQVSIQTDTPSAKEFIDKLMVAKFFNPKDYNFSSQTLPSLISSEKPEKLTNPFHLPATDVFEDLWMRNQITPTYIARTVVSSLLLAYGMIQNDLITMIAALLFTPFLAQVGDRVRIDHGGMATGQAGRDRIRLEHSGYDHLWGCGRIPCRRPAPIR